jgi:hypothetical protein
LFGSVHDGGCISTFLFKGEASDGVLSLETGDRLALCMKITLNRPMRPTVLGLTDEGAFVFEMSSNADLPPGTHEIELISPRLEVGVGKYILVPAMLEQGSKGFSIIGEMQLELEMTSTNWSEPPLVHLDGLWFSGDLQTTIKSKINAWV